MADVCVAIRAYLHEVAAAHIRGASVYDAPTIMRLAEDVNINASYLVEVLNGDRSLNLVLLWQLMVALERLGLAPTVEDAIYWPPLRSARSIPALDEWQPAPVASVDEPRLHLTLGGYLAQMNHVARSMDEPLALPNTRALAKAAEVSMRTVQRLQADKLKQINSELLGGVVRHFHSLGINVRPAQLVAEPV